MEEQSRPISGSGDNDNNTSMEKPSTGSSATKREETTTMFNSSHGRGSVLTVRQRAVLVAIVEALLPPMSVAEAAASASASATAATDATAGAQEPSPRNDYSNKQETAATTNEATLMEQQQQQQHSMNATTAATASMVIAKYWETNVAHDPVLVTTLETLVLEKLTRHNQADLLFLLTLWSTALGTTVFFGIVLGVLSQSLPSLLLLLVPFDQWPLHSRTRALHTMMHGSNNSGNSSRNWVSEWMRLQVTLPLVAGLKRLLCAVAYSYVHHKVLLQVQQPNEPDYTGISNHHAQDARLTLYVNPFWDAMGFPAWPAIADAKDDARRVADAHARQAPLASALQQSRDQVWAQACGNGAVGTKVHSKDQTAAAAAAAAVVVEWECDVVIVGSGAGGCVAARVLAQAGWDVIVLEKSMYKPPASIPLVEAMALDEQYEQHGLLSTSNNGGVVSIMAGSAVGGGTAINWSCCLPLPETVRREWASVYGLDAFGEPSWSSESNNNNNNNISTLESTHTPPPTEYETALQYILHEIGVSSSEKDSQTKTKPSVVTHNAANRKLQEGCDALEYAWEVTGQNLRDTSDEAAGYIGMGDRYGNKNSGVQTFLVEAIRHGARIVENCRVERILTSSSSSSSDNSDSVVSARVGTVFGSRQRRRRATGVECHLEDTGTRLIVHARHSVIVAAGALRTPGILQRSNLRNPHIGRHLRLHPATGVMGYFSTEEAPIDAIRGAPMTTVCNEFAQGPNRDGYGVKIENPCAYPGLLAAASPWISVPIYKDRLLRYRHCAPLVLVQRDSGEGGRVRMARNGKEVIVDYSLSECDKQSMIVAMQGAVRIMVAAKSIEVATGHIRDYGFKTHGKVVDETMLEQHLDSIKSRGMKDHEVGVFSAHQMGTCRMTSSPLTGAVDCNGETWECDDLFVMDASIFPTASGSNPMVTVFTLAFMLSTRLDLLLQLRENSQNPENEAAVNTGRRELRGELTVEKRARASELAQQRSIMRTQTTSHWSLHAAWLFPILVAVPLAWTCRIYSSRDAEISL